MQPRSKYAASIVHSRQLADGLPTSGIGTSRQSGNAGTLVAIGAKRTLAPGQILICRVAVRAGRARGWPAERAGGGDQPANRSAYRSIHSSIVLHLCGMIATRERVRRAAASCNRSKRVGGSETRITYGRRRCPSASGWLPARRASSIAISRGSGSVVEDRNETFKLGIREFLEIVSPE